MARENVFASLIYQVYSLSHGPRAPVTMSKLVSVSGQPREQQVDGKTEDGKEATICNNFERRQNGEYIFLENVARAFNPKHVIQELNVEFTVPIDRAGTHGNDILTAAGRSLGMHQKLIWITLHHLGPEMLVMNLWIVGRETEFLVERTDDVSQIWRHS